ncbi:SDR family NAD(P)-dependent oxidoreductase [Rhodomicrobium vannielii ATCC 17100]|uniref:SDR family NAD(P)-dependent oxidoreductase n=1 Tax=Rhodomicrobium vannielii TaxID=1069 RepID=UPI0019182D6B|nr:SDR family NAD(P)-dependent oxidoreductase [Rhodomicrobium vannielii]MBJ7534512.1 SDR family NAD(P)-dependent oxidoreductase [Rhodomicrobium vannielii ATCC 17100]
MPLPVDPIAGKVILLTGANRGIGLATAKELKARGATIVAGVRQPSKMAPLEGVIVLPLDVANAESCRAFVDSVEKREGRIDGLINNAAILLNPKTPVLDMAESDLLSTLEIDLGGPIRMCQLVVPRMLAKGSGRIVNVSSGLGAISDMAGGYAAYRMAKLALNGFTKILAAELGPNSPVKVNSLCPGWVRTDMGGAEANRDPSEPAREIADLVAISADGPTGGFFRRGEPADW